MTVVRISTIETLTFLRIFGTSCENLCGWSEFLSLSWSARSRVDGIPTVVGPFFSRTIGGCTSVD
jgi:hypothetical protein